MSQVGAVSALSWLSRLHHRAADSHEAVALAVHALILNHGFRPAELPADDAATPTPAPAHLPSAWGGSGFGGRYRHARSAMTFDIRAVPMGGRLVVHATALEEDTRLYTLDVRVAEYITPHYTFPPSTQQIDWHAALTRLPDLATLVQVQLAHRLVPDAAKDGYEAAVAPEASPSASAQPAASPRRRHPPVEEEDPLRDHRNPLRVQPRFPGYPGMPLAPSVGADDLAPPGLQPGALLPPMGGNLMGPGNFPAMPGERMGGRVPRGMVPGARFDPYGPAPYQDVPDGVGDMPGFEDEHQLRGPPRGARLPRPGQDDGPPPGMYW